MDQPTQPKGNFIAFLNRKKQPGDKRPMFVDGRIAKPGSAEEFPLTLWAFEYTDPTTGELQTGFNGEIGTVSIDAPAPDQVQALLRVSTPADILETPTNITLAPRTLAAFAHKPKEGSKPNTKTHYAYVNFGDGTPLVEASIWLGTDRYGRAMVSGNTQFPLNKQTAPQPTATPESLVAAGIITKGMPKGKGGKGGRE